MSISIDDFNKQCYEFASNHSEWKINTYDGDKLILAKDAVKKIPDVDHVFTCEYNVIYSQSYEVPVMYFCVSKQSGSPLDLEEIFALSNDNIAKEELGRAISQVEHPALFRPFYMIHPCKTRDFMQPHIENNPDNYLISWLSTVGTLLGLKLDSKQKV